MKHHLVPDLKYSWWLELGKRTVLVTLAKKREKITWVVGLMNDNHLREPGIQTVLQKCNIISQKFLRHSVCKPEAVEQIVFKTLKILMRQIKKDIWCSQSGSVAADCRYFGGETLEFFKEERREICNGKKNQTDQKTKSKRIDKYFALAIVSQVFENLWKFFKKYSPLQW